MGQRARSARKGRPHGADPFGRDAQDRTRIAQLAAKYIAEHGLGDWSLAKRKAARQLGLSDRAALPGDDEIETALADYHALFGGAAHAAALRAQREEALLWLRRLAPFAPRLSGGVAAGWATVHSDIRLDVTADDPKSVELTLINQGVDYRALPARAPAAPAELFIETPRGGVRLVVRSPVEDRQRPHAAEPRLDAVAVEALLLETGTRD